MNPAVAPAGNTDTLRIDEATRDQIFHALALIGQLPRAQVAITPESQTRVPGR